MPFLEENKMENKLEALTSPLAILSGTLSPEFTTSRILQIKIPRDWQLQNTRFTQILNIEN
jgi:hypothetical protein